MDLRNSWLSQVYAVLTERAVSTIVKIFQPPFSAFQYFLNLLFHVSYLKVLRVSRIFQVLSEPCKICKAPMLPKDRLSCSYSLRV